MIHPKKVVLVSVKADGMKPADFSRHLAIWPSYISQSISPVGLRTCTIGIIHETLAFLLKQFLCDMYRNHYIVFA
ncbi:MAG: hypothetical protein ACJ70S_08570, partial [Nitrososphaera sp.]